MYFRLIKGLLDRFVALLLLMLLLPLNLITCIIVMIDQKGKVFFIQERPGQYGEIFAILKFKTMVDKMDQDGISLPDHLRVTVFGQFLRKTSIDEIPQLINIIRGDMSLVGPRPLLQEYLPLYSDIQHRRHEVKPGMTGWAQVNEHKVMSWQDKFDRDIWYVDHLSFWLDMKILILTVPALLFNRKTNKSNTSSYKFTGN